MKAVLQRAAFAFVARLWNPCTANTVVFCVEVRPTLCRGLAASFFLGRSLRPFISDVATELPELIRITLAACGTDLWKASFVVPRVPARTMARASS